MKTKEQTRLIFVFCILFLFIQLSQTSFSQWLPEQRLTNSNGSSVGNSNNSKWITVSDNFVHVVWTDDRNGRPAVFYKRSSDHGATWSADIKINNTDSTANYPAITSSGQFVHIVWSDSRSDTSNIYYINSSNSGSSWGPNTRLSANKSGIGNSISCENEHLVVCWTDTRYGNGQVYLKTSSNNGQSWNDEFRIMNPSMTAQYPSVCQSGSNVHIAWNIQYPSYQVRYIKSTDYGLTWGDQQILVTAGIPWIPSISVSGNNVHVTYFLQSNGQYFIYYRNSTNNGNSWNTQKQITRYSDQGSPQITSIGESIHIVYIKTSTPNPGIYSIGSFDNGIHWCNQSKISSGDGGDHPSIVTSGSGVFSVWNNSKDGNEEIYFSKNPSGNNTFTVSGLVTYKDNNQPVSSGYVKALQYDSSTASIITVDSTTINPNGTYLLSHVPQETLDLMFYQDDDMLQFVPTYYVSTIDWRQATKIYPTQNLTNINCQVYRIENQTNSLSISGNVMANVDLDALAYVQNAIVYVKNGSSFKNYGISGSDGNFSVTNLASGTYSVIAYRMGYAPSTQEVTVTNTPVTGISFNLGSQVLGVEQVTPLIPNQYSLSQNYPNPFNPTTQFNISLPKQDYVKLTIFDVLGKEIGVLLDREMTAGTYSVSWNAADLPSGLYFYRLETSSFTETKKMILIK